MDCVYSSWATSSADGFREADLVALRRLVPLLALAIKCVSLARIARTLVEVYLGHDAGERVLSGRISRGVAERINAASGSRICAVTRRLPTRHRPTRSFRCSTITPRP
jgi:adenylate cyclase